MPGAGQMVVLENVVMDKAPSREELAARMAEKARQYGVVREDGLAFFFERKNTVALNMTHMETPLEPLAASQMGLEGRVQTRNAIEFLKSDFPDCFADATVRAYGFPGIRKTRWIKGAYQLNVEDVRFGPAFRRRRGAHRLGPRDSRRQAPPLLGRLRQGAVCALGAAAGHDLAGCR